MKHFEFTDNHYKDKRIVVELTENTVDIAVFDVDDPDQINPPNRYAHASIAKKDLKDAGLAITTTQLLKALWSYTAPISEENRGRQS